MSMVVENSDNAGTQEEGSEIQKVIPVVEEFVEIDTKLTEKETIKISKNVSQEEIDISIPLITESFDIERVPVERYVDVKPEISIEGDLIVIPVIKEVIVKRYQVTEEIRLHRKATESQFEETVLVKKEEVTIEKKEN